MESLKNKKIYNIPFVVVDKNSGYIVDTNGWNNIDKTIGIRINKNKLNPMNTIYKFIDGSYKIQV